jgi:tetratricopeptide (TPR) repeat protein
MRKLQLTLFFFFLVTFVNAQNCCHKRSWQADEMPVPPLMEGIGKNHFSITANSDSAQLYFDQGLKLIHSYWDFEAYRAFKHAATIDTGSAMPLLGIAMVYYLSQDTTPAEGVLLMKKAKQLSLKQGVSGKERDLVNVWYNMYLTGNTDTLTDGMFELCRKYPDDTEFQLILANELIEGYVDGKPTANFTSCDSILQLVLGRDPGNFAAHHYYIHNIEDTPFAEKGLASAEIITSLAPNSGHINHMPGHIYYHLGDYEAARNAFLRAKKTDSLYLVRSGVDPINHWNNIHNHIYLAFTNIEQGRYKAAMGNIKYLQGIGTANLRMRDFKTSENARAPGIADMYLSLRVSDWSKCISLASEEVPLFGQWAKFAPWYRKYLFYYAHGMLAFENREKDSLNYYCKKMKKHLADLKYSLDQKMTYKETRTHFEKVFYDEVLSCKYALAGKFDKAYPLLDSAIKRSAKMHQGDPPPFPRFTEETKVRFLVMQKKYAEAVKLLMDLLETRKNSPLICQQIADVYFTEGNRDKAKAFNQRALDNWKYADPDFIPYRLALKMKEKLIEK